MSKLTGVGQINKGDKIVVMFGNRLQDYIVDQVLNHGKENEEIIVNSKINHYFITSMAIDGTSWAKSVNITGKD